MTSPGAYVAGVGLHPFGRFPEKSLEDLAEVAVRDALKDAGISFRDIQAAYVGNVLADMAKGSVVLERLGLTGIPITSVENACASGGSALGIAHKLVVAGVHDVILVLGVEKASRGFIPDCGYQSWQKETGLAANPIYFALAAQRYMAATGASEWHLAQVSVKNHAHAVHNPAAMYRKALTIEQVLHSPVVCEPLTLLMLCSPNEGAAAAVVMSAHALARRKIAQPVRIRAAELSSRRADQMFVPSVAQPVTGPETTITRLAAQRAYEAAALGPDEIDVFELQDTDSGSELIAYEDIGICPPGEGAALLESGATAIGGNRPVNPSGGLLSKGEPLGASGLGQIFELVTQLRGRAKARQVVGARAGLAHTLGAGGVSSVTILST